MPMARMPIASGRRAAMSFMHAMRRNPRHDGAIKMAVYAAAQRAGNFDSLYNQETVICETWLSAQAALS